MEVVFCSCPCTVKYGMWSSSIPRSCLNGIFFSPCTVPTIVNITAPQVQLQCVEKLITYTTILKWTRVHRQKSLLQDILRAINNFSRQQGTLTCWRNERNPRARPHLLWGFSVTSTMSLPTISMAENLSTFLFGLSWYPSGRFCSALKKIFLAMEESQPPECSFSDSFCPNEDFEKPKNH